MNPAGFPDLPDTWRWAELGTLCIGIEDGDWIETKDQGGCDYRLLQVSNIGKGAFRETSIFRYISQETFDRIRCTEVRPNHVLVSRMPDPVGRAWCVEELAYRAVTAVDVAIVETDPESLLPKFCAYYLNSPINLAYAASRATGTTRLRITRRDLATFPIPVPNINDQDRIVQILSSYDNLIENNSRRIEILEEMAQAIYREWFVEFRYPGHEDVPLVDSELGPIPEGWEWKPLFEVAEVTFGFPFSSEEFNTSGEGTPLVRIRDVAKNRTETWTREVFADQYRIVNGDLLVGMDGEFHMCKWAGGDAALNQRVARFRPDTDRLGRNELFYALRRPISDLNQQIVGTTVAHLGKKHLEKIQVLVPSDSASTGFCHVLTDLFELELNLRRAIQLLAVTRDLLLPRLISGEIDVSDLDIELAGSVA